MTTIIEQKAQAHAIQLRAQRAAYLAKQAAPEPSWTVQTSAPAPVSQRQVERQTGVLGSLVRWFCEPYTETQSTTEQQAITVNVDNSAALATVDELKSVVAGQSAELAQLRQAVLVLAQSAKSVESAQSTIVDGIEVIKQQTKEKIKPFDTLTAIMSKTWREMIEDTTFANHDATVCMVGRGIRAVFSLGSSIPAEVHAAKREVFSHMKTMRSMRDKLEATYEYAVAHYPNETAEWVKQQTSVMTVASTNWTMLQAFGNDFISQLQTAMSKLRKLPY